MRQNRFFACLLGRDHLWTTLTDVDRNRVRAGIAHSTGGYPWPSVAAHLSGTEESVLDMEWWLGEARGVDWADAVGEQDSETASSLRRCTYAGRPDQKRDVCQRDVAAIRALLDARAAEETVVPARGAAGTGQPVDALRRVTARDNDAVQAGRFLADRFLAGRFLAAEYRAAA